MLLNKIIKMKNNKYKIILDNENIITYDNVILENDLLYKKSIDNKLYKKIITDTKYFDIYNNTVKYILKRIRSEKEINKYLDKYELSDIDKNKILNKLKSINLINDDQYCKSYISDKLHLSNYGINKIRKELINNGISNDIIDSNLNNIDKEENVEKLEKIILKKLNANKKYSSYYIKQKILNDMINLGYDREDIIRIIDKNSFDDIDILNSEFNKLYNKLSKKYSGFELKNKLKKSLISKGFSLEDINDLINENTED